MDDDVSSRERSDVSAVETRALITSLAGSVIVGGTAIVWGILSGSNVVLFDGVYMVAGIALVVMSLVASRAARARPTGSYPFGRHAATPIAVVVQASAMIATLIYGVSDAIAALIAGGSEASGLSVMLYGVVSALASVVLLFVLRKPARVSALVKAEVVTWRAGALQSAIVAVGGAIAVWLTSAGYATLAGLVDPLLVLIACAMIAPMAISLLREGGRELLEAAPSRALSAQIAMAVADGAGDAPRPLPAPIIRATKLGQRLYVEVDFVIDPLADAAAGLPPWTIGEEDAVRRAITTRLDALGHEVWATVELTTDPGLAAA